jgi:hypothetical protein
MPILGLTTLDPLFDNKRYVNEKASAERCLTSCSEISDTHLDSLQGYLYFALKVTTKTI